VSVEGGFETAGFLKRGVRRDGAVDVAWGICNCCGCPMLIVRANAPGVREVIVGCEVPWEVLPDLAAWFTKVAGEHGGTTQ